MNKKICFLAQFPPPMHGLSKAVETLFQSQLSDEFEKIDITNNKSFLPNLIRIFRSKADLFYFTISQTKGGNIRDLIILKLINLRNKKCLVHLHGGYYRTMLDNDISPLQRQLNLYAFSKISGVIVLGATLRPIFEGIAASDKIFTVANCVEDKFLMDSDDVHQKLSTLAQRSVKHILYLSNFIREKGYPQVLKMAMLEKRHCDEGCNRRFHFNFAGKFFDLADEKFFFDYILKNELNDYVTYHGIVGGEEKRQLLRNSDVFVLLTTYPKEGQPICILEAMGNGMIVITTDHAGIPDIVDNRNGVILSKSDDNMAENALQELLEKCNDSSIGKRNYQIVLENYSQEKYLENMHRVFHEVYNG